MELAEVVGQLAGLRRFPVLSLGGEAPNECLVEGAGLAGDRIFDLFDAERGEAFTALGTPFLLRFKARYLDAMVKGPNLELWIRVKTPDGVEVALSDRSWLEEVSLRCARQVILRARADAAADPAPIDVLSAATIRFLEQQYGGVLEAARIRSNLLLDLPEGRPFEEDRWIGRQLWVGDVLIELVRPSIRCLVTSLDAETRERSPGVLSAIVRGRGGKIGVSARALTGNRLRLGDPVAIIG